jgi:nucleoside-diphosphate-sugar epimerase
MDADALFDTPRAETIAALASCPGDIMVLGAGGKMGPSLARMARRAAGDGRRVLAVSRWTDAGAADTLRAHGVEVIQCDLLDRAQVAALPDAPNVIFMAGQKFGTTGAPHRTWAMNAVVPVHCAERFAGARTVVFSTGNVYPLTPVSLGGSREDDAPGPVGEYAASCLARERIFEHAAHAHGTPVAIVRLNYAIDVRYGVLVDVACRVHAGEPVPLAMGHVNVIWQEDANRLALECLAHAATPPFVLNVTGSETVGVRDLAQRLGAQLGRAPVFAGEERADALLSNTTRLRAHFAAPATSLDTMITRVAEWVRADRPLLGKPTRFEARDGRF